MAVRPDVALFRHARRLRWNIVDWPSPAATGRTLNPAGVARMMLALEMYRSLPRHVAGKAIGGRVPGMLSGYAAPLRLVTIDEPRGRAGPGWARLRTRLSGICGSDLGALSGRTSLYFSGVVSMPFVPGHEVVAELLDDCEDLPAGTRVVDRPGADLRRPRRRAVRGLRAGRHQPLQPDHRRRTSRPGCRPASARTPAAAGARC